MLSLQQNSLNFNNNIKFDFNGGNLSSEAGLLLVRSFMEKLGVRKILQEKFDNDIMRTHTISSVIEQLIYTNISGHQNDYDSNALRNDPLLTSLLDKEALASQATISRVINGFSEDTYKVFNDILELLYKTANQAKTTENIILDLDSTNIKTFGKQEGGEYIYHYSANGYHPLVLYDGLTGDLMKFELRKGKVYTSKGVGEFLRPVLTVLKNEYPDATILIRGDSGFATPEIYDLADEFGVHFIVKLKANATLYKLSKGAFNNFLTSQGKDYSKYQVQYEVFDYTAQSWSYAQRVVCKIERAAGELVPRVTFIATTLGATGEDVFRAYNKRGMMENYIKETKLDFGMKNLSHSTFQANHCKAMILALAYSIINLMKRLVLPEKYKTSRMLSLRSLFIKVACRVVKHSRKMTFKLCSSYPLKNAFVDILLRIEQITFA